MNAALLLLLATAASGVVVPLPEDLPLVAAGASLQPGTFVPLAIAGAIGVFLRDSLFFGIGRLAGEGALRFGPVKWLIGVERLERMRDIVASYGGRAVLGARFAVGFRTAGFLAAGIAGVRIRDFIFWDLIGIALMVPAMIGLGALVGDPVITAITWVIENPLLVAALAAVVGLAWFTSELSRKAEAAERATVRAAGSLPPPEAA